MGDRFVPGAHGNGGSVPLASSPSLGVATQLPLAADPGTFTGWMLASSAEDSGQIIAWQMKTGMERLGLPAEPDNAIARLPRSSHTDHMITCGTLLPFLAVRTLPPGRPQVVVIHSLGTYDCGIGEGWLGSEGGRDLPFHPHIYGLEGEAKGGGLPQMIQICGGDYKNMTQVLRLQDRQIPTAEMLRYFADEESEDLIPPWRYAVEGTRKMLSCVWPLPLAWAPYFLEARSPVVAFRMAVKLVATLVGFSQRAQGDLWLDWFRASLVDSGGGAPQVGKSQLHCPVEEERPNEKVTAWMTEKTRWARRRAMHTALFLLVRRFKGGVVPGTPVLQQGTQEPAPPTSARASERRAMVCVSRVAAELTLSEETRPPTPEILMRWSVPDAYNAHLACGGTLTPGRYSRHRMEAGRYSRQRELRAHPLFEGGPGTAAYARAGVAGAKSALDRLKESITAARAEARNELRTALGKRAASSMQGDNAED